MRKNGLDAWVVLHIEVQSQVDLNFPQRMYIYHYRVFDKHPGDVVSLAVLDDTQVHWRPNNYQRHPWGCSSQLIFPVVKLSEMEARAMQHLTNPFAWLILAHLRAQRSPVHSESRLQSKVQLVRGLYGCELSKQQILDFFHLVDWVLVLSPELEYDFQVQLALIEEETNMPYITSIERLALQRGREEGREAGFEEGGEKGLLLALARILQIRFSVDASPLLERLHQRGDAAEIERVIELAATAKDYAALERQVGKFA